MGTTLAISSGVLLKAGKHVSLDISKLSGANVEPFINQAESLVCVLTHYDWISGAVPYASLKSQVKYILQECVENLAAIQCVTYDMDGYGIAEAEDTINVLRDSALRDLSLLRDQVKQDFMRGA